VLPQCSLIHLSKSSLRNTLFLPILCDGNTSFIRLEMIEFALTVLIALVDVGLCVLGQ
jgi:hypothetical protein